MILSLMLTPTCVLMVVLMWMLMVMLMLVCCLACDDAHQTMGVS
jgi:hypothetical protein